MRRGTMAKLEIRLLGTLSVAAENPGEFPLPRKNKAVLAALALAGPEGLSREKLVDFFWRDRGDKRARASLRQAFLFCHFPIDKVVGVDHARQLFQAARHPKSFLSLDRSDHLLTTPGSAAYAARIIAAWASRLI